MRAINKTDRPRASDRCPERRDRCQHTKTAMPVRARWLATPDLVKRLQHDLPLNQPDYDTVFNPGEKGYNDHALPQTDGSVQLWRLASAVGATVMVLWTGMRQLQTCQLT